MKTLGQIFSHNRNILPELVGKAQKLSQIDKLFRSFLDASLAQHCHLADISVTEAVVITDSSAWAMRLRYAIPDILKNVKTQPEFKNLKKIRYSVSPNQNLPTPKKVKVKISAESEKLWKEVLEQLRKKNT